MQMTVIRIRTHRSCANSVVEARARARTADMGREFAGRNNGGGSMNRSRIVTSLKMRASRRRGSVGDAREIDPSRVGAIGFQ